MAERLSETAITEHLAQLKDWKRQGNVIRKQYPFSGFIAAMAFVNLVAAEAEAMDHHPDILIEFNRVTLTLSTHSAGGLTELDFQLARKVDA